MTAYYHLPGLFEFYELYRVFLPLFRRHREYFYDWCGIGSVYGAPAGCLWGGGRIGSGGARPEDVVALTREYGISARLTFSNSLLRAEHLSDKKCNALCALFEHNGPVPAGVILHSDQLLEYLREKYPGFYFVSSTTKVLTEFRQLREELERPAFRFVVPDFRLNKALDQLMSLPEELKDKIEFLCNEACWFDCPDRKACYENVSRKNLDGDCEDHIKIVFTGVNGRIVDMEISGGAALPTPEYMIYGSKGAMVSEGDSFRLRYLDPACPLSKITADPETPGKGAGFSNKEELRWVEETVSFGDGTDRIWDALYESIRFGKSFPVKLDQAKKVIEVIETVKRGTVFEAKQ